MLPQLHTIGSVAGKHGFSGELVLHFANPEYAVELTKGNFLFVEFDGKGVPFLIENTARQGKVVKLVDVNSVEEAEYLAGRVLLMAMEQPETDEMDVVGFRLLHNNGEEIGLVVRVEVYPAGEMLVIQRNDSEILIPLVESWITEIDAEKQHLTMELPEGLTDI